MDWLDNVNSPSNPDMQGEFIGNLIMKDGFKVRYNGIEVYGDSLRKQLEALYTSKGYVIDVIYNSNFSYCEVTAVKNNKPYLELAAAVILLWAIYRVYTHM